MPSEIKLLYQLIRLHVNIAVAQRASLRPSNLKGRGHDPRVTLDTRMAGILRGEDIPNIDIPGLSGGRYFPREVFAAAHESLKNAIGSPVLSVDSKVLLRISAEALQGQKKELETALTKAAKHLASLRANQLSEPADAARPGNKES
ncbi:MAG: hypothetical protein K7J47_14050 [Acidobacteria bacterium]|jgi:hypothetical protein|nr:hypothetical protein [Bryobacteraceae bacterium CoA2 C42]